MNEPEKEMSLKEFLFKTLTFLASSAQGCINEPKFYGPFRLIDTMSKLCNLPKYSEELEEDKFLSKIKKEIDSNKYQVMTDVEAFSEFLSKLVKKMAKEYKRRKSLDKL